MADASTIFDWLALLAIGMMSITVPTYAISVSFMGRERRRAISERERRVNELQIKVNELSNRVRDDPGLVALESEIASYRKDIRAIKGRVDSLSVYYACFLPLFCFAIGLAFASWGLLILTGAAPSVSSSLTMAESSIFLAGWTIIWLLLGMAFLSNTLTKVNRAAIKPETLSAFRLAFESGSTSERFLVGIQRTVRFLLHNTGKESGEKILAQIYFPDNFEVSEATSEESDVTNASVSSQTANPFMTFPSRQTAAVEQEFLHEDMVVWIVVVLRMPTAAGTYKVPCNVWERRLGMSKHELVFEITATSGSPVSARTRP